MVSSASLANGMFLFHAPVLIHRWVVQIEGKRSRETERERERERESVCVCERGRRKERDRDREMLRDGYQRVTGGERRVDSGSSGEHEGVNVGVEGEFKAA